MARLQALVAQCIDVIALEGRQGIRFASLLDIVDPHHDQGLRRLLWQMLRRQQARGVLFFFYDTCQKHQSHSPAQEAVPLKRKRKRSLASSSPSMSPCELPVSMTTPMVKTEEQDDVMAVKDEEPNAKRSKADEGKQQDQEHKGMVIEEEEEMKEATAEEEDEEQKQPQSDMPSPPPPTITTSEASGFLHPPSPRPIDDIDAMAYETAIASSDGFDQEKRKVMMVVACEELRFRALNMPLKAILSDLGEEHFKILEAVGQRRQYGITIQALTLVLDDTTVKKLHNALDTLLSYRLVVKRMLIVAKPIMRRLNIVHLPRFAAEFTPHMFDESAEFESDDQCKKILCAATENYLRQVPTQSAVLADLGRELGFQKRHLDVLKNHLTQEMKKDDQYHLELFQAVLQPQSNEKERHQKLEPKILNCVRYKPPTVLPLAPTSSTSTEMQCPTRGIAFEVGLLQQIHQLIHDAGDHGATIVELRNHITLPGNKLPYKLVNVLASKYRLKAETIILGKNKAFRLFAPPSMLKKPTSVTTTPVKSKSPSSSKKEMTPSSSKSKKKQRASSGGSKALRLSLQGSEVEVTRSRRREHILERLKSECIISISSLRASVFAMEKSVAKNDPMEADELKTTKKSSGVGMVDTRSISRIATEMENDGVLRLLQLPLPARNVSTKFRALRCVILPGYEENEQFIQAFVKNYCRDERLRRIHQNVENSEIVQVQAVGSGGEEEEDAIEAMIADEQNATAATDGTAEADVEAPVTTTEDEQEVASACIPPEDEANVRTTAPSVVRYKIARFSSQIKSGVHAQQYRRFGFAYGVMYRCKVFHRFLWEFLHAHQEFHLHDEEDDHDDVNASPTPRKKKTTTKGIVFSRENVLHSMPVHLYIQAFSGGAILTPSEEKMVHVVIQQQQTFAALPEALCAKIWSHESTRTAKVLGTLADLGLITPHKIGMKHLIKILRAGYTDGSDGVLSRALKDNALGGLFRLQNDMRIQLDDQNEENNRYFPPGTTDQHHTRTPVNQLQAIRIVGTTEKTYSFGNRLPLAFAFQELADVDRYWEALECLCLEQMVMEVANPRRNEPAVCEVPRPIKTRARRMFRILAWIPKSQKPGPKDPSATKSQRPSITKRSGIVSRQPRTRKRRQMTKKTTAEGDTDATAQRSHKRPRTLSSDPAPIDGNLYAWSDEHERNLLKFFIENCQSRWRISIPQGLQRDSETVAFRHPSLSRTGFGLVTIARKLGKRKIDVKKRLKEKLMEPSAKWQWEQAKQQAMREFNPLHHFEEQDAILAQARMTALFRRAIMMIVSPPDEYHPLVAEELISFWSAEEIRAVWRYLWLKNWIVRATERDKIRGYVMSQRLQDFLKLTTLSYPLLLFRQAAEQESMIHSTLEEVTGSQTKSLVLADQSFEAEFPTNATPGHCALELACQVMGTCSLVPIHTPMAPGSKKKKKTSGNDDSEDDDATVVGNVRGRRRKKRPHTSFLNDKSLRGGSGFAAHLAKYVNFSKPSLVIDSWHVETHVHAVTLDDRDQLRELEAFSMEDEEENEEVAAIYRPYKPLKTMDDPLETTIIDLVRQSGEEGMTLPALVTSLQQTNDQVNETRVRACVNWLVDEGALLYVNAYSEQRLVVKDHGDLWLLRPFSLVHDDKNQKPMARVVFEGEKDTLSFPWLKMDGGTNYRFLFSVQRKLLSFVLMAPGITEDVVYRKMDRLLTMQDTREALALLVEEGLVYTRATTTRPVSLFDQAAPLRVVTVVGNVLAHDRTKYVLHYFPHIEAIQRFGSIVQDYQNEVTEFASTGTAQ